MKKENIRLEKRIRIKPKQKQEIVLSTDRVEATELFEIFESNLVKKKNPFDKAE